MKLVAAKSHRPTPHATPRASRNSFLTSNSSILATPSAVIDQHKTAVPGPIIAQHPPTPTMAKSNSKKVLTSVRP